MQVAWQMPPEKSAAPDADTGRRVWDMGVWGF